MRRTPYGKNHYQSEAGNHGASPLTVKLRPTREFAAARSVPLFQPPPAAKKKMRGK
jgi:hypothetical protein